MLQARPPKRATVSFFVLCAAAVGLAVGYVLWTRGEAGDVGSSSEPLAGTAALAEVRSQPHLMFRDTSLGTTHGRLVLETLNSGVTQRFTTELGCERLHFAAGRGVCLTAERGFATVYRAITFDRALTPLHTMSLAGVPSRVRVSPDGMRAGMTVFVSGDSYAPGSFSTRTTILDTVSGKSLGNLEQYAVLLDGKPFKAIDFNFWGVTFANRGQFFATLGTGGKTYLVQADTDRMTARVLHENVECPSLSPDQTRLVFKKRMPGARLAWRLHVLTLPSLDERILAEERSVDDQAEWLDENTVIYSLPNESKLGSTDVWEVAADGSGAPRRLVTGGWSPAVVSGEDGGRRDLSSTIESLGESGLSSANP